MAYKLIWSPAARDDLHDIVVFIARDNPHRAMSFGYELISEIDRLQAFPELGRIVPEYRNDDIREIVFRFLCLQAAKKRVVLFLSAFFSRLNVHALRYKPAEGGRLIFI
jgi:plasmid stabilization system protein ParE